ncbi:TlpA family protein disulfide reductase [Echinicola sp. CAU 1574]|uniref:TlpA family protein disulfide reductase n=1 Tax=Echinicola arenosa TaxID=2774144 RepID=A0ABR9APY2_9BACT|nr:TlpA disulfide reductase family protein [Echinicola arenosa]MBD8490853.1 TlpA family protein disulfide reductase [Echinicola arenosa]
MKNSFLTLLLFVVSHLTVFSQNENSPLPPALLGNWLKTDGSNEWVYGFDKDKLIMDSQVYSVIEVKSKKKKGEITYKTKEGPKSLFYEEGKNGKMLIGTAPNTMNFYSRNSTTNPDYKLKEDNFFEEQIFRKDSAIFKGYIKGYSPEMNKTGMINMYNILSKNANSTVITIQEDGTFYAKFPILSPTIGYGEMLGRYFSIYLEPGKTTFQFIDIALDKSNPIEIAKPPYYFMGTNAKMDKDLKYLGLFDYSNIKKLNSNISEMDKETYISAMLEIRDKEKEKYDKYKKDLHISKKAQFIIERSIDFLVLEEIIRYEKNLQMDYGVQNEIPSNQNQTTKDMDMLRKELQSFLQEADLNNPYNLIVPYYIDLVKQLASTDVIIKSVHKYPYKNLEKEIDKKKIPLTEEQRIAVRSYAASPSDKSFKVYQASQDLLDPILKGNSSLLRDTYESSLKERIEQALKENLGLEPGLLAEIMISQEKHNILKQGNTPYTPEQEREIPELFKYQFIADHLLEANQHLKEQLSVLQENNKATTAPNTNTTSKTEADKLFDSMMAKFKGKVVYVDFWATWCGPCITNIEAIAPLKEEIKEEDVVFVYITNQSSPEEAWNLKIPDIKGEHFRLTADEWNYLSSKFQVSGLPHYTLVDKEGNVVRNNFRIPNSQIKDLIFEYLN